MKIYIITQPFYPFVLFFFIFLNISRYLKFLKMKLKKIPNYSIESNLYFLTRKKENCKLLNFFIHYTTKIIIYNVNLINKWRKSGSINFREKRRG